MAGKHGLADTFLVSEGLNVIARHRFDLGQAEDIKIPHRLLVECAQARKTRRCFVQHFELSITIFSRRWFRHRTSRLQVRCHRLPS